MNAIEDSLETLRHELHRNPELAGQEQATAARMADWLAARGPTRIVTGLGGHGLAGVWTAKRPGPRVLLRAELDGLPIPDAIDAPHASASPGRGHKCGHDGHMAILAGVATRLKIEPPECGEVVLLFQPAEETGQGARWVLDDPVFAELTPDWCFSLHNLPGFEAGRVVVRRATFAAASRGLAVELSGASSHAAEPERGRSPALAVASLIQAFSAAGQFHTSLPEAAKATVIHAAVGEPAFGTSPGQGRVLVTLRSYEQEVVERLEARCRELAERTAAAYDLKVAISQVEPFPATLNDDRAVDLVERAADAQGLSIARPDHPFPWSEDFGHFTAAGPGALFGLGAGQRHPALHNPDYDFPDALLQPGVRLFERIARLALEQPASGNTARGQ